jgi:hypothetical protein
MECQSGKREMDQSATLASQATVKVKRATERKARGKRQKTGRKEVIAIVLESD